MKENGCKRGGWALGEADAKRMWLLCCAVLCYAMRCDVIAIGVRYTIPGQCADTVERKRKERRNESGRQKGGLEGKGQVGPRNVGYLSHTDTKLQVYFFFLLGL